MITVKVTTRFDITATGVTGHCKPARMPFTDQAGHRIADQAQWNRSRNQQRNWETLQQIISLRTQLHEITLPACELDQWTFDFTTEVDVFNDGTDPVGTLKSDSAGVPMITELDNDPDIDSVLVVQGDRQNVWFEVIPINNALEN